MKKIILLYFVIASIYINAQSQLPKPAHIIMVMFQNKDYTQIVGSPKAPYFNSLLLDTNAALFSQSYALTHPSQPNYLMLYSGSNQGITDDNISNKTPFTTCNLGASLLAASKTFTGYSESMPSEGYLGVSTSLYARKHNPWSNWQGTGTNQVPPTVNQPFSVFPGDYNLLPDVSIVVPNIINCMHDGTIEQGDAWLQTYMDGLIQWSKTHNSLVIITFDEDNSGNGGNRIFTCFIGQMVAAGSYTNHISHFNVLRTIEDIYGLPSCGTSSTSPAIDFVWKSINAGIPSNSIENSKLNIWPVPEKGQLVISAKQELQANELFMTICDLSGRQVRKENITIKRGENIFDIGNLEKGIYIVNISGNEINFNKKIAKE